MALKVTNNATSTLAIGINNSILSITLADGSTFPTLGAGDWFWGTLVDASNNIEVVKVTARSGAVLTIGALGRAQDGTTAKAYLVGDRFELRPTAALFNDKSDLASPSFTTGITTPAITIGATLLTPTPAQLNYVAGVTSAIQTQLDGKATMASGTVCLFFQASAPTGWTKIITQDNKALRIVSGTGGVAGGSVAFTTAFASQAVTAVGGVTSSYTLQIADIPSHTHYSGIGAQGHGGTADVLVVGNGAALTNITSATGGSGGHVHGFTGTAINMAVQYIDTIMASRN